MIDNPPMKNIATVLEYHDRTKHRPSRYAASLGYMDWETQPDPFRRYSHTPLIALPFSDVTPPYHMLFQPETLPKAPLCIESLSQLLRYSLGLAAWKSHGGSRWPLRCNASSGNLHPTECYVIAPPIPGIGLNPTLSHYAPKENGLELLHTYAEPMREETLLIALSSVVWREAWKYGERCWRYCQLDAGHAYESVRISAQMLGWECEILSADSSEIARLCGLDQHKRFELHEWESPDMLLRIGPGKYGVLPNTPPLESRANLLSPSHHEWPILETIDTAAAGTYPLISLLEYGRHTPEPSKSAGEIILKRRSAQMMDGSSVTENEFRQMLDASLYCSDTGDIHFMIFLHRVEGLEKGLYCYLRRAEVLSSLRDSTDPTFLWKDCGNALYLLRPGDYRGAVQMISCNQEIAKDGAFSFGMLSRFSGPLEERGGIGYKNLYHQCGAIGQMLYLEATSLGLSATGIGCFLDDEFHTLLGLRDQRFQSLYHFTIGRGIVDTRVMTLPPY